jgi:hypothetical protein
MNLTKKQLVAGIVLCWLAIIGIAIATWSIGPLALGVLAWFIGGVIGRLSRT